MDSGVIGSTALRALEDRLARLRTEPAYRNYTQARERVLDMRAQVIALPEYRPSA